jgi:DNA-binding GntR family transcriptional regulator
LFKRKQLAVFTEKNRHSLHKNSEKRYTLKQLVVFFEEVSLRSQIETIVAQIRADIQSGKLRPRQALPTRRAMAEEYSTTPDTITKVLQALEIEGLITKSKGLTMRVNIPRERITANNERFADIMAAEGHDVEVEHIKTPGVVEAPPDIAKVARWQAETPVIERVRREIIDGAVYRYSRKVYRADLVPAEHLAAMQADHTYNVRKVIEQQRPLSRIEERLIARAITDKAEAEMLGTIKGAPVLEQWKINYDQKKNVAWVSIVVFNAQYFEKRYDYAPGDEPRTSSFLNGENY